MPQKRISPSLRFLAAASRTASSLAATSRVRFSSTLPLWIATSPIAYSTALRSRAAHSTVANSPGHPLLRRFGNRWPQQGCTFAYGAFNRCLWKIVHARTCDFSSADMSEMELRNISLDDDRFVGTSFFRTKLVGLDFTSCQLESITISDAMTEVYGAEARALSGRRTCPAPWRYH